MQKWVVEIGVEELDWPAQNPDLNSIEHLWDELEHLCQALIAQQQVPAAVFQHLVESLPRRVEAVIAAKGGPTIY